MCVLVVCLGVLLFPPIGLRFGGLTRARARGGDLGLFLGGQIIYNIYINFFFFKGKKNIYIIYYLPYRLSRACACARVRVCVWSAWVGVLVVLVLVGFWAFHGAYLGSLVGCSLEELSL